MALVLEFPDTRFEKRVVIVMVERDAGIKGINQGEPLVLYAVLDKLQGETEKEPWLEYKHLSRAPLPGYTELLTPDGET